MDWEKIRQELLPLGVNYGLRVIGVIAIACVAWIAAGVIARWVSRGMSKARLDETLVKFTGTLMRWLVLMLAFLGCMSLFGIETTSFAAVLGAAGLAIGLAFQGALSNFAAGVMLLVFRPFKVGDVVNAAGQLGKVDAIEIFTTALDTFDNRRMIIPNSALFGAVIENVSHHRIRRADIDVGVSYAADIDQTREVLTQAAGQVPGGLEEPAPAVVLLGLGDSSVNWSVRVWTNAIDFGDVKQATIRAVKYALDEAGISIPFPQLDVHLDTYREGDGLA